MKLHFIGADGASMSALKKISARLGYDVSGSDLRSGGHDQKNIEGKDLVVFSGAIPDDNVELFHARKLGVPVMERSEFLAFISGFFDKTVAIAGCHGKTTTTAMTGEAFASKNPTVHVGGEYDFGFKQGKELFVTEACEYRRSFLFLKPDVAVITNVDFDHPDTYKDVGEVAEAFSQFVKKSGFTVYNGDDKLLCKIAVGTSVGWSDDNDYVIRRRKGGFDLFYHEAYAGGYECAFDQPFNIKDAALAAATALEGGVRYRDVQSGIARFKGVKRRGEIVCFDGFCTVVSDYSHHPAEIRERISSLKERYGSVAVIFQPHTYSRTKALLGRFSEAFTEADEVAFTNTFAAREKDGDDHLIYEACKSKATCSFVPLDRLQETFVRLKSGYACVALMGAGDFQAKLSVKTEK